MSGNCAVEMEVRELAVEMEVRERVVEMEVRELKMELCVLGEYLIDFTPAGVNEAGMHLYARNPGGAPVNVACGCAKLGVSAGVMTGVSRDPFGVFLRDYLGSLGNVDMRGVKEKDGPTGLAFVTLGPGGERDFAFFRDGCADTLLAPEDIDDALLEECSVFHFSSVSLVRGSAREATFHAASRAKELGKTVSFDINYRAPLWDSEAEARRQVERALGLADIVKVSEEEAVLFGGSEEGCAEHFCSRGASLTLVTMGGEGSFFDSGRETGKAEAFAVDAVDTTGAGDCFMGAFLSRFIRSGKRVQELTGSELQEMLVFANAAGALCTTGYGAIAPQPTEEDIEKLIRERR